MTMTNQETIFSNRLRSYIRDYFNDREKEIEFYNGLRNNEEKQPDKNDILIQELSDIIEDIHQRSVSNSLFNM